MNLVLTIIYLKSFFKYHKFQWHARILKTKYVSYNTAFDTENYVVSFGKSNSSRSVQ